VANLRITEKDKKEYNKLMKNAKTKMKRLQKNYGVNLIGEIPLPTLSAFQNRKQFNEWKQEISSFTNRNNQRYQYKKNVHGVVASKAMLNEIERNTKRAQRIAEQAKKKMENKPFISGGEIVGTVGERQRMMARPNIMGFSKPVKFDFNNIHSYRELFKRKEVMEKKADPKHYNKRSERMKELYINGILEKFNSDAESLAKKLEAMPADDFYVMFQIFDEFETTFDPSPQKYVGYDGQYVDEQSNLRELERVENYVDIYFEGGMDTDLLLKEF
jgi:hypothetical protein